jgi:hypothetical protein
MTEYIVPNIRRCYEYQPNILMCWAAVGLTMWRFKHGRGGPGHIMDTLLARPGGERYFQILDYASELNAEMGGDTDMARLPAAEAAVRRANPRFASTPSGLPGIWANAFFTWLGCSSTSLASVTTAGFLKERIRDKGPIAIFTRNPGHLQIIVGYWEGTTPDQPQLILFNPERYILERIRTGNPNLAAGAVREDRLLWAHWISHYSTNLVDSRGWHF